MTNESSNDGDDDKVGYGRPPRHKRWKPGVSGNPRGRPKKRKSVGTILDEILNEKVQLTTPEGTRKVARLEALFRIAIQHASKGNLPAIAYVLKLAESRQVPEEFVETAEDLLELENALKQFATTKNNRV